MQKFILTLFFILLSFRASASDYDTFILNSLRVNPFENVVNVEMVLGVPAKNNVENDLKNGKILKFSIDTTVLQERSILPSKKLCSHLTEYFIRYDALTRQFMVISNAKITIKNTDITYLLQTLIHNLKFEIPIKLAKGKHYYLDMVVSLIQSVDQPWIQKNIFFLSDDIIQPATFKYEFDY